MSGIDANRAEDLETILHQLSAKIIDYVKKADSPEGCVGNYLSPEELTEKLKICVAEKGQGIPGLMESADQLLEYSVVTWHKTFLEKLYGGTNPVGIASDLLLSILNTNSHVYTVSPVLTLIEKYVAKRYAGMFGFKGPHAGGLTFPGGSYSNITAMHMARSLLHESTKLQGMHELKLAAFTSRHSHYSIEKSAILLGLGAASVFKVAVKDTGEMDTRDLLLQIGFAKSKGYTPFFVNATAGSTVYGSFDDFNAIATIADTHKMWMHIDGSWGGNVVFSHRLRHKMAGAHRSNSITVNPHKMLGVPVTCSFLLLPNDREFQRANSLLAPYLFHTDSENDENYDLADGTMGCGRRPDALKLYLGWQYYGTEGYQRRIDHAFEMTAYFANRMAQEPDFELVSTLPPPCLQICFYYHPASSPKTAEFNTNVTRSIAKSLFREGKFLIDYSPHTTKGEFFRVVLNAPNIDRATVDKLINDIKVAGQKLFPSTGQ